MEQLAIGSVHAIRDVGHTVSVVRTDCIVVYDAINHEIGMDLRAEAERKGI